MRIALALLVVVVAACKSKSAPAERASGPSGPTPEAVGSGPPAQPGVETQVRPKKAIFEQQPVHLAMPDAGAPPSDLPASIDGSGTPKGPAGTIAIASKTSFDHTDLSADAVGQAIAKDHLAALGNCYRATLARDASIQGAATLALTVSPTGAVGAAKATAPDPTLQSCFSQAMLTWRFPVPKNADGEPAEAGFQIALTLAPE